jgi:hypothetical protein
VLRAFDAQELAVGVEHVDDRVGDLGDLPTLLVRAPDDLVVDVGQVHHLRHVVAGQAERAPQQVLEQERAEVAEVRRVVDRGAAGVERDRASVGGRERLDGARHGVVQAELGAGHRARVRGTGRRTGKLLRPGARWQAGRESLRIHSPAQQPHAPAGRAPREARASAASARRAAGPGRGGHPRAPLTSRRLIGEREDRVSRSVRDRPVRERALAATRSAGQPRAAGRSSSGEAAATTSTSPGHTATPGVRRSMAAGERRTGHTAHHGPDARPRRTQP